MRGAPHVLWTCDKCHASTTRLADQGAPGGWKQVSVADLDSTSMRKPTNADWCGPCVREYLSPLTPVKSVEDGTDD